MKKFISFSVSLLLCSFLFTNCKDSQEDKKGNTIHERLSVAFDEYDKPLIDSILNTKIDFYAESHNVNVNRYLMKTLERNDVRRFRTILEKGVNTAADLHYTGSTNLLPLLLKTQNIEFFNLWMRNKKKIINKANELDQALIIASQEGNIEAVKFLIDKGAKVDFNRTQYVNALSGIKLRAQPSVESKALAGIAYQEQIDVSNHYVKQENIEGIDGYWVYAYHKGQKGYVFSGFLNE